MEGFKDWRQQGFQIALGLFAIVGALMADKENLLWKDTVNDKDI